MDQPAEGTQPRCPMCGAALQPAATACPACGTLLAGLPLAPAAPAAFAIASAATPATTPATTPAATPAATSTSAATVDTAADRDGALRCDWCGQLNPAGSEQCAQCGAMFPRPETDAALLRQAEERMRAETETLMTMRKRRQRKGLGRLFSN